MAAVTTQTSVTVFRPCASKSRFLTGSSGKLNRELSVKPAASGSFKVEAKKGEWLPGLASPGYLDGRLAMLAFLGFVVQHNVTGKGPFDNLLQHLSDPWHNTIVQTFRG